MTKLDREWNKKLQAEGLGPVGLLPRTVGLEHINNAALIGDVAEAQYRYYDAFSAFAQERLAEGFSRASHEVVIPMMMGQGATQAQIMKATGRGKKYVNNRLNDLRKQFGFSLEPELYTNRAPRGQNG